MEKKLPDDQLEEFLRNSFKDYQVDPSDNVWNRINQSVDTNPPYIAKPIRFLWIKLAAASILSIVISYLIYSNIHLNNKLKDALEVNKSNASASNSENNNLDSENINKALQKLGNTDEKSASHLNENLLVKESVSESILAPANSKDKVESKTLLKKEIIESASGAKSNIEFNKTIPEISNITSNKSKFINGKKKTWNNKPNNNRVKSMNPAEKKNLDKFYNKTNNRVAGKSNASSNSIENSSQLNDLIGNALVNMDKNESSKIDEVYESTSDFNRNPKLIVDHLITHWNTIISERRNNLFVNVYPVVNNYIPVRKASTEVAIFSGPLLESGDIHEIRPIGQVMGPDDFNTFATFNSWQTGVTFNKSINKNLYAYAGLGFKHLDVLNRISDHFEFGDRKPRPGGQSFQHDFDFKIKSNAGNSEIIVKSEQLDPRATINDTEPIKINVQTNIELNYVTVPLGLQYRFYFNKFYLLGSAGLNIDIATSSKYSPPEVQIFNSKLKITEKTTQTNFNSRRNLVFNGRINLGLGYQVAPRITVFMSPELYLPLSYRTMDHDSNINVNSWGLQAGVSYSL